MSDSPGQIVTREHCSAWGYHPSIWESIVYHAAQAEREGKFENVEEAQYWVRQAFPMS